MGERWLAIVAIAATSAAGVAHADPERDEKPPCTCIAPASIDMEVADDGGAPDYARMAVRHADELLADGEVAHCLSDARATRVTIRMRFRRHSTRPIVRLPRGTAGRCFALVRWRDFAPAPSTLTLRIDARRFGE